MAPATTMTPRTEAVSVPVRRTTIEELSEAADRFGQMDLGDPQWAVTEPLLDRLLGQAVLLAEATRAEVWQCIAADPGTPLVVRLRTFAAVVGSLQEA